MGRKGYQETVFGFTVPIVKMGKIGLTCLPNSTPKRCLVKARVKKSVKLRKMRDAISILLLTTRSFFNFQRLVFRPVFGCNLRY